jgi:radical SAM protein with 4Fe4S-binding SPASM domain
MIKKTFPKEQICMISNGITFIGDMERKINSYCDAGVDIMVVDLYKSHAEKLLKESKTIKSLNVIDFFKDWKPKGLSPFTNYHGKINRTICFIPDLLENNKKSKIRIVDNRAGSNPMLPLPKAPLEKTCTIPFRMINIRANGDVPMCCIDFAHDYVCGNVNNESLGSIWKNKYFYAVRKMLYNRKRLFTPCGRCDYSGGMRCGLLPKYGEVTKRDLKIIKKVVKSGCSQNIMHKPRVWFKTTDDLERFKWVR